MSSIILTIFQVARKTFGLSCVVVDCDASTTLDTFASALLLARPQTPSSSLYPTHNGRPDSYFSAHSRQQYTAVSTGTAFDIANVVLAKNLHRAPYAVQIQALELLRTRRIYTRTAVQAAPKTFLFVPVLGAESGGQARVARHLNDHFFLAHWHDPEDGFANLEDVEDGSEDDTASAGSVVKKAAFEDTEALISETVSPQSSLPLRV